MTIFHLNRQNYSNLCVNLGTNDKNIFEYGVSVSKHLRSMPLSVFCLFSLITFSQLPPLYLLFFLHASISSFLPFFVIYFFPSFLPSFLSSFLSFFLPFFLPFFLSFFLSPGLSCSLFVISLLSYFLISLLSYFLFLILFIFLPFLISSLFRYVVTTMTV